MEQLIRPPLAKTFEEAWRVWQNQIGMMRERFKNPPKAKVKKRRRVVIIPDLHVPHHEPQMLQYILTKERQADVVVLAGDLIDSYAVSHFVTYERVTPEYEWAQATLVVGAIAETWPDIRVIIGNHDKRLDRQLRTRLNLDMIEAITMMTGGVICPVTALTKRFKNITVAKHDIPNTNYTLDWLTSVGDCLVAHPEAFSRIPSNAVRKFEEWVSDNRIHFGLDRYRLIMMGHTHQLSAFPWRGSGQLLMEVGCLCKPMAYQTEPRIAGRPQVRAYVYLEQDQQRDKSWVTDLNSVGWHCFDFENVR